jgi:hypothetical protein
VSRLCWPVWKFGEENNLCIYTSNVQAAIYKLILHTVSPVKWCSHLLLFFIGFYQLGDGIIINDTACMVLACTVVEILIIFYRFCQ